MNDALEPEDYGEPVAPPTDEELKNVAALAARQLELERAIADATTALEQLQAQHKHISQVELPETLEELGLSEFKLKDGSKVTIRTEWIANISKEHQAEAFEWLEEHGHGDLIKRDVTVQFGRGEGALAKVLLDYIDKQLSSQKCTDKRYVHYQTLRGFVREQAAVIPFETFGVMVVKKAQVGLK